MAERPDEQYDMKHRGPQDNDYDDNTGQRETPFNDPDDASTSTGELYIYGYSTTAQKIPIFRVKSFPKFLP